MDLQSPVQFVKGVGPQRAESLAAAGVRTTEDLLLHLPMRYEDRSAFARVAELRPGMRVSVSGEIAVAGLRRARRMTIYEIRLDDGSGRLKVVFFNQPFLKTVLARGRRVVLFGLVERDAFGSRLLVMRSPQYEIVDGARGWRHPHGPHRARLREARNADRQAAAARALAARGAGAGDARRPAAAGAAGATVGDRPGRGAAAGAPARRRRRPRRAQPLPLAGPPEVDPRGAAALPARPGAPAQRPARREEARGLRGRRAGARGREAHPALPADRRAEARAARDRRRPALAAPDEPPDPGRRRLGQDGRGAARDGDRARERPPGGLHGADRDPGRAALPDAPAAAAPLPLPRRAADLRESPASSASRRSRASPPARRRS